METASQTTSTGKSDNHGMAPEVIEEKDCIETKGVKEFVYPRPLVHIPSTVNDKCLVVDLKKSSSRITVLKSLVLFMHSSIRKIIEETAAVHNKTFSNQTFNKILKSSHSELYKSNLLSWLDHSYTKMRHMDVNGLVSEKVYTVDICVDYSSYQRLSDDVQRQFGFKLEPKVIVENADVLKFVLNDASVAEEIYFFLLFAYNTDFTHPAGSGFSNHIFAEVLGFDGEFINHDEAQFENFFSTSAPSPSVVEKTLSQGNIPYPDIFYQHRGVNSSTLEIIKRTSPLRKIHPGNEEFQRRKSDFLTCQLQTNEQQFPNGQTQQSKYYLGFYTQQVAPCPELFCEDSGETHKASSLVPQGGFYDIPVLVCFTMDELLVDKSSEYFDDKGGLLSDQRPLSLSRLSPTVVDSTSKGIAALHVEYCEDVVHTHSGMSTIRQYAKSAYCSLTNGGYDMSKMVSRKKGGYGHIFVAPWSYIVTPLEMSRNACADSRDVALAITTSLQNMQSVLKLINHDSKDCAVEILKFDSWNSQITVLDRSGNPRLGIDHPYVVFKANSLSLTIQELRVSLGKYIELLKFICDHVLDPHDYEASLEHGVNGSKVEDNSVSNGFSTSDIFLFKQSRVVKAQALLTNGNACVAFEYRNESFLHSYLSCSDISGDLSFCVEPQVVRKLLENVDDSVKCDILFYYDVRNLNGEKIHSSTLQTSSLLRWLLASHRAETILERGKMTRVGGLVRNDSVSHLYGLSHVKNYHCIISEFHPLGDVISLMRKDKIRELEPVGKIKTYFECLKSLCLDNGVKTENNLSTISVPVNDTNTPLPVRPFERRLSLYEFIRCMYDLCYAVLFMSNRNIVHGDISLANMFVNADRRLKLGDFGFSIPMNCLVSEYCGTYDYMPSIWKNFQLSNDTGNMINGTSFFKFQSNFTDVYAIGACISMVVSPSRQSFEEISLENASTASIHGCCIRRSQMFEPISNITSKLGSTSRPVESMSGEEKWIAIRSKIDSGAVVVDDDVNIKIPHYAHVIGEEVAQLVLSDLNDIAIEMMNEDPFKYAINNRKSPTFDDEVTHGRYYLVSVMARLHCLLCCIDTHLSLNFDDVVF